MRRFKLVVIFLGAAISGLFAQKNQFISGGNGISCMVDNSNTMYVWGNNTILIGDGLLGIGGTASYVTVPTQVSYFTTNGITIKQASCGTGTHFLALDCNGNVWAWGDNTSGQIGNGVSGGLVSSPVQVSVGSGALSGTRWDDGSGHLTNVKLVYASNSNSFAILDDGSLVSWGSNSWNGVYGVSGMLGDGTTLDKYYPVYVLSEAGSKLSNVVDIYAGDNVAYALVDPEKDGIGTVYSWGNGITGTLGRAASGSATNPSSATTVQDSYAQPVRYANNSPMNNITQLSAGDVFGMALDVNSYVWTWGNGGWNNATGNSTDNYTGSDPRRVIKGNTTGASSDGTYLVAKSIAGGQGFGMAVTIDGKPVAWGGTGTCDNGGMTGTGSTNATAGIPPTYIQNTTGTVHSNVAFINRGDLWGFYGCVDGSVWAFGCNTYGQLGIGSTTSQAYAQQFTLPIGYGDIFLDPVLSISPRDTTVCASSFSGVTIKTGFNVSASTASCYKVSWYKDGTLLTQGTMANASLYNATSAGTYKVEVIKNCATGSCSAPDTATAQVVISEYPATYSVPSTLTFNSVNDSATVNVISSSTTNAAYDWYDSETSTTSLGTSYGSNSVNINVSSIAASGKTKTVYVEESGSASGMVFKKAQSCNPYWLSTFDFIGSTMSSPSYQTGLTISEPLKITELKIPVKYVIFTTSSTVSATIQFGIYKSKSAYGSLVADQSNLVGTFSTSLSRTRGTNIVQDTTMFITVPVNIILPAIGTYFISIVPGSSTNVTGSGYISLGRGDCQQTLPVVDDVTGSIIQFSCSSQNFTNPNTGMSLTPGHFFDIKFVTSQHYCTRVPVTLKTSAGCSKLASTDLPLSITSSIASMKLCPGEVTTLKSPVIHTQADTVSYDFVWYKGDTKTGTIIKTSNNNTYPSATELSDSVNIAYTDPGTYTLLVRDNRNPSASACQSTTSVTLASNSSPTYTVSGGGTFCSNASAPAVTYKFNGISPFIFDWSDGTDTSTVSAYTSTSYTVTPSESGTFTLASMTDKNCPAAINNSLKTTVTKNIKPTAEWSPANPSVVCKDCGSQTLLVNVSPAGGTGSFGTVAGLSKVSETSVTFDPSFTGVGVMYLNYVYTDANGCKDTADSYIEVCSTPTTVFLEDFGKVDTSDHTGKTFILTDYSDYANPTSVTKTTTDAFRYALTSAPLGATYHGSTGPVSDGEYSVAGYLTQYNSYKGIEGAKLQWSGNVTGATSSSDPGSDHSGSIDGACLFVNCPANTKGQSIYTRTISNIPAGKTMFFECWIAVFTNSAAGTYAGVDVNVKLTDGGNAANIVALHGTATRQADGGGAWVKISGQIVVSGTSVSIDIVNNSSESASGNDLVIDDIKLSMATSTQYLLPEFTQIATGNHTPGESLSFALNKDATVYLVPSGTAKSKLAIVAAAVASKSVTANLSSTITIPTTQAIGSTLVMYAVDASDSISAPTGTIKIVDAMVSSISLSKTTLNLSTTSLPFTLTATVNPSNASNKTLTWSVSPTGIVSVANGVITVTAAGTATVKCTANDGSGKSASCVVTVTNNSTLSVTPSTLKIVSRQGAYTAQIVSNTSWTASSNASWLQVNPASSTGNAAISLGASANTGLQRSATVTIAGLGATTQIISVIQEADSIAILKTIPDTTFETGAISQKYLFAKYFKYIGTSVVSYSVLSDNPNVLVPAVSSVGFGLVQYTRGSAHITVVATSANGATASIRFTVTVTSSSTTNCSAISIFSSITNNTCADESNGSIEVTVTGGTKPYSYKWSTSRTGNSIVNMPAGDYTVIVTDSNSCVTMKTFTITAPSPIELNEAVIVPTCNQSNGSVTTAVTGGTSPYTYSWNTGEKTSAIAGKEAGLYTVSVADSKKCQAEKTFDLSNANAPDINIDSVKASNCSEKTGAAFISISGGEEPYSYKWTNDSASQDIDSLQAGTYSVTVTDNAGCQAMASLEVPVETIDQPTISLVTVDEQTGYNIVAWQKDSSALINSYNIYKELSQAGIYDSIGNVSYESLSFFEDVNSNSREISSRYKISAIDKCGNSSPLSPEHKTIHLQKNIGLEKDINLDWDAYEGIDFYTYIVYRKSTSKGTEEIKRIPSSITRYTDVAPPADVLSYYVAIDLPQTIDITVLKSGSGPYSQSLSNIAESKLITSGIGNLQAQIIAYPNPVSSQCNVLIQGKKAQSYIIHVTNAYGQNVQEIETGKIVNDIIPIDARSLSPGLYFLKIESGNKAKTITISVMK